MAMYSQKNTLFMCVAQGSLTYGNGLILTISIQLLEAEDVYARGFHHFFLSLRTVVEELLMIQFHAVVLKLQARNLKKSKRLCWE
ncbi:hypothetical protein ACOMHN_011792 [Nucella lapillus]